MWKARNLANHLGANMKVSYVMCPQIYYVYPMGLSSEKQLPCIFEVNGGNITKRSMGVPEFSIRKFYQHNFQNLYAGVEQFSPIFEELNFEPVAFVLTYVVGEDVQNTWPNGVHEVDMRNFVRKQIDLNSPEHRVGRISYFGKFILRDKRTRRIKIMPRYIHIPECASNDCDPMKCLLSSRPITDWFADALRKMRSNQK